MFAFYLLEACFFLIKDWKGVGPVGWGQEDRKEEGGIVGEETIIRVYCVRKESTFNKKADKKV